jgi:hypothetical protein
VNYWGDIVDPTHNGTSADDLNRMFVAYGVKQTRDSLASLPFIDLVWYGLIPSRYYPSLRDVGPDRVKPELDYEADTKAGLVRADEWAESGPTLRAAGLEVKHWIVVYAIEGGIVKYHDPLYPGQQGASKTMTSAQLTACEVYPGRARLGMVERPAEVGDDDMALWQCAGGEAQRMRSQPSTADPETIVGTFPVGKTFNGDILPGGLWVQAKAKAKEMTVDNVPLGPSAANTDGTFYVYIARSVIEPGRPPPPEPPPVIPPSPPATQIIASKLFGVHELGGRNMAGDALAKGCKAVMCFESATGAAQLSMQYPDAIVMHRKYFKYQMPAAELLAQHGINVNEVSASRAWYRGCNENDVQGIGSGAGDIRARAQFDVECATLLKRAAPNARWVAGGFAHGNPDFTNPDVCAAMQQYYAPHYNSGLFVYDVHNYTKPAPGASPKDFSTIAPIWLKRSWEFLFTKCGFDPRVRAIVHSEAGHECGFGGMNAAGFTVQEFSAWCDWTWMVQTAPLIISGVSYPSPVLCETGFQIGDENNGSGGWFGYSLFPYYGHMGDRWNGRVTAPRALLAPSETFVYDGVPAPSEDVPEKDLSGEV